MLTVTLEDSCLVTAGSEIHMECYTQHYVIGAIMLLDTSRVLVPGNYTTPKYCEHILQKDEDQIVTTLNRL